MSYLGKYMSPQKEICDAVEKMTTLYQLINQNHVEVFTKKSLELFSGTMRQYEMLQEISNILKDDNKPWTVLLKATHLLDSYRTEMDLEKLHYENKEELEYVLKIAHEGIEAKKIISEWLKDLTKSDFAAIHKAIDDVKAYQYQLLKIKKINNWKKGKSISLFNEIYEIKSVDEMIMFLNNQKEINDCLILSIMRNAEHDWKGIFYIFFIYNGTLYIIDNSERRLNMDNTEGCRSPGRYLERKYENMMLPDFILYDKVINENKLPVLKDHIFKVSTIDYIQKVDKMYITWLEMFMYRIMGEIVDKKYKTGYTHNAAIKLLPGKIELNDIGYGKIGWKGGIRAQYLIDKYGKEAVTTALATNESQLPAVVGTKKFIEELIIYNNQQSLAIDIQQRVKDDYIKNHEKVYRWINRHIEKYGIENLIIRAIKDIHYPITAYHQFGGMEKVIKTFEIINHSILESPCHHWKQSNKLNYITFQTEPKDRWSCSSCYFCKRDVKVEFGIVFKDYKQWLGFFQQTEKQIPKEMIEHLHQAHTMYIGNSILDDMDPIDMIRDPWFTARTEHKILDDVKWFGYGHDKEKCVQINIKLCKLCYNKFENIATTPLKNLYKHALNVCKKKELLNEIENIRNKKEYEKATTSDYIKEYISIIINDESTINEFMKTSNIDLIKNNKHKKAITKFIEEEMWNSCSQCDYRVWKKLEDLSELPLIDSNTKYQLAKSLGLDIVKPEEYIVAIAKSFGYDDVQHFCKMIGKSIGERINVVDFVLSNCYKQEGE